MKLVDILAQELKAWPEGVECLSQLKVTGYIISGKGFDGRAFDALQIADETLVAGAIVTRAEWQAAVDALNSPKVVEWDGAGIPPIGTVCEYQTWVNREWKQTRILAHHLGFAVHSWSVNGDDMEVDATPPQDFRPIRTAEQVAADDRIAAAYAMCAIAPSLSNVDAISLYDALYRKQVAE